MKSIVFRQDIEEPANIWHAIAYTGNEEDVKDAAQPPGMNVQNRNPDGLDFGEEIYHNILRRASFLLPINQIISIKDKTKGQLLNLQPMRLLPTPLFRLRSTWVGPPVCS